MPNRVRVWGLWAGLVVLLCLPNPGRAEIDTGTRVEFPGSTYVEVLDARPGNFLCAGSPSPDCAGLGPLSPLEYMGISTFSSVFQIGMWPYVDSIGIEPRDFVGSAEPTATLVGDCNRDGIDDVVVAIPGIQFRVYRSDGLANFFSQGDQLPLLPNGGPGEDGIVEDMDWIDINNDGYNDIVLVFSNTPPAVNRAQVWLSFGAQNGCAFSRVVQTIDGVDYGGSYSFGPNLSGGSEVMVFDFNRDGVEDVVLADESGTFIMERGVPNYNPEVPSTWFARTPLGTGVAYHSLAFGDFNRDGLLDIVGMGLEAGGAIGVVGYHEAADSSSFKSRVSLNPSSSWLDGARPKDMKVLVDDIDQDGWLDAVFSAWTTPGIRTGRIHYNSGQRPVPPSTAATWRTPNGVAYSAVDSSSAKALTLYDFDNDDDLDLVFEGRPYPGPTYGKMIMRGDPPWGLSRPIFIPTIVGGPYVPIPDYIAAGDITGDGRENPVWSDSRSLRSQVFNGLQYVSFDILNASLQHLEAVDMNSDGLLDIALVETTGSQFAAFIGGNGPLALVDYQVGLGSAVKDIIFGDFNRDGLTDVIYSTPSAIEMRVGQPGNNVSSTRALLFTATGVMEPGDFDGDGDLDFVASTALGNRMFMNDGTGVFNSTILFGVNGVASDIAACDFGEGGGDVDFIFALGADPAVMYENNGSGTVFNAVQTIGTGTNSFDEVICADFDNDGYNDVFAAPSTSTTAYHYWRNNGAGGFDTSLLRTLAGGPRPSSKIVELDFDGDGDLDIMGASVIANSERWWWENPIVTRGQFNQEPTQVAVLVGGVPRSHSARTGKVFETAVVPMQVRLFDANQKSVPEVKLQYSLRGGGDWQPLEIVEPAMLKNIPMMTNPTVVEVEWRLPTGSGTQHINSDDVRVRAVVVQPHPRVHVEHMQQRTSAMVTGPFSVRDSCAGHACPERCYFGQCYESCNSAADCLPDTCYRTRGLCNNGAGRCYDSVECLGTCVANVCDNGAGPCTMNSECAGLCLQESGRCDVPGDPTTSLDCPVGMVEYAGSCFDPCAGDTDCTPPQLCYNFVCQADPCDSVHCPVGEVCYGGSCFADPCANDGDCTPPNVCYENHCEYDPCAGVTCPVGDVCYEGSCFDPCTGDIDCDSPQICFDSRCYDPFEPCEGAVCGTTESCVGGTCAIDCVSDGDCEPYSIFSDGSPRDCDGIGFDDPACLLCFNGRCLAPADPCDGVLCPVGEVCHEGSCFAYCGVPTDCVSSTCYADVNGTDSICLDAGDPCASVTCPDDYVCHQGSCFRDCGSQAECTSDSDCVAVDETCQDGFCLRCNPDSEECFQFFCAADPCDGVFCPVGDICYGGSCFSGCSSFTCYDASDSCYEGRCSVDACDGVLCPVGEECVAGTCYKTCEDQAGCGAPGWTYKESTPSTRLAVPGAKEGGASWADYDQDGDLDVVVNTQDSRVNSRLFRNNGDTPATFADVTFLGYAPWLGNNNRDRSVIWGDIDNDGNIDLLRNSARSIEVFRNKGRSGSPPFGLGVGPTGEPSQKIVGWPLGGTFSVEGMVLLDFDGDSDLDLLASSQTDLVLLENSRGTFLQTNFPTDYGLPTGATASDYCTAADLDVDSDIDIVCRIDGDGSRRSLDIWLNDGTGSFVGVSPNINAQNTNKGGVAPCDLNNDGLFDLVWTDGPNTRIIQQTTAGNFTVTDRLEDSSRVVLPLDIDGVDCGDYDNDGDLDILLAGARETYIFRNDTTDTIMLFEHDNRGVLSAEDTESANFVDFDNDGDLDVFLNSDVRTQTFTSGHGGGNLLRVRVVHDFGSRVFRDAIGATVKIKDADGDTLGVREVNGGKGHGSQGQLSIHYGMVYGPDVPYEFEVTFPNGVKVRRCVSPASLGSPDVLIRDTDTSDLTACADPDWATRIVTRTVPEICWEGEYAEDGTVIRPPRCASSACEGVQCADGEVCHGGSCFDYCTDDMECDPGSICYNNRCVDAEEPYCDGITCPVGDVCYRGECFQGCLTQSDCAAGDHCFQGRCAPEDCAGIAALCEGDELCYRGACYDDCSADPSICPANQGCYEGRCADNGCEALTDRYDADHPFRTLGRRIGSSQYSTPWYWPRPIFPTSTQFDNFASVISGIETNEVPALDRARVALVFDRSLSDVDNPRGQYVLYLTQGFDSGIGAQQPITSHYNVRVRNAKNATKVIWDNDGEAHHVARDAGEDYFVIRLTSGVDETAGVAIGPFPAEAAIDWSVTIQASISGDARLWEFYNPDDGRGFPLRLDEPLKIRSLALNPDTYLTPSTGMPCDVDPSIAVGMCSRGTTSCSRTGEAICDPTIYRWPWELCDGRDNNCNGQVDENVRYTATDWRQGSGGWSFFVTTDTFGDLDNFMNFKPRGADDRRGSTAVAGYGGAGIQRPKKTLVAMHRDIRTGMLAMPLVHGEYISGLPALTFSEDDIYMTLGLDYYNPDSTFIAFHDDMLPVPTNDETPDSLDVANREIGLDFRLAKPSATERESDSVAIRPLVRPWDITPAVTFSMEFDGVLGGTNSEVLPQELEWRLYQPRLMETVLRRTDDLEVRTTLRPALTSVCAASNTSPSGCVLGRYQCVRGRTYCGSATDGACDLCFDSDGDGYERYDAATCPDGTDCNDSNPLVYPGAEEICDGYDNNCDGEVDVSLDGAVVFGETITCGNGEARCGPEECQFGFLCTCPNGPEDPNDPTAGNCFCATSFDVDGEPAESTSVLDAASERSKDRVQPIGCATGGSSPSPWVAMLLALVWAVRRREKR